MDLPPHGTLQKVRVVRLTRKGQPKDAGSRLARILYQITQRSQEESEYLTGRSLLNVTYTPIRLFESETLKEKKITYLNLNYVSALRLVRFVNPYFQYFTVF